MGLPVPQPAGYGAPAPPAQPSFYGAQHAALQQWFLAVDTDRSGQVSPQELQQALMMGGLNFSLKLVASLVRMHDASNDMTLSFDEFVAMQTYLNGVQQAFTRNAAGQSKLALQHVQSALRELGYDLDMQPDGAFYKMVQSYDFSRNGQIGLDSFIAMNIQLRNCQKMFNLFDAQRQGRVTMDFNQLVWTVAQL
jgi:Ca2+-binding EF-hand superfamily protein